MSFIHTYTSLVRKKIYPSEVRNGVCIILICPGGSLIIHPSYRDMEYVAIDIALTFATMVQIGLPYELSIYTTD